MTEFRFAEMNWLFGVWGVLLLAAVLVALEFRGRSLLDRMVSPWMQSRLVSKTSLTRRIIAIALFSIGLLCLVFAMMRPQWGMTVQKMTRVDSQIMICLDVSKSMLAEDVVPNRLERAQAEIDSLLGLMDEGQQVGLIAFAGKASVLCPMTTDFGFLRLILAEATPSTVGLGGTRIGEAIQKAADGFRETGDVNRMILLITDGEDHDSFPIDAAEKAVEKGVKIVSIGFGDEAGSKIEVSDPVSGARSFLKDREGNDVLSRLDGATLREIAMKTEGAYIPAGTGALDLQSIYDAHINTLLKGSNGEEERIIRNEGYQWFVLLGLIFLVLSMITHSAIGSSQKSAQTRAKISGAVAKRAATWLLVGTSFTLGIGTNTAPTFAKSNLPQSQSDAEAQNRPSGSGEGDASVAPLEASEDPAPKIVEKEQPPRVLYNRGIRLISTDPDRAERLLTEARNEAGVDGELRYRSLYNLGWVEVTRAEKLLESEPEQALKHLELAASRFSESIRIRPESTEARHNLEVISQRILELRDKIAQQEDQALDKRLDALIQQLREHQSELQSLVTSLPNGANLVQFRPAFRKLGVTQRRVISDVESFATDARSEVESITQEFASKSEEAAPDQETQLRFAQLSAMLPLVERSIQRLNKSRSFTRRSQADRAFVRWASALSDLKRARDKLRNPIEILGVLIADSSEVAQRTQQMLTSSSDELNSNRPAWLTGEYLSESQQAISDRVSELYQILSSGVEQMASEEEVADQPTDGANASNQAGPQADPQTKELIANIKLALPSLEQADSAAKSATASLTEEEYLAAIEQQSESITELMNAAEYFYDLRRLIEVMHRDQQMLLSMVSSVANIYDAQNTQDSPPQLDSQTLASLLTNATELETKNIARSSRLAKLLQQEEAKLETSQAPNQIPGQAPPQQNQEQLDQQKQRLGLANSLLESAVENMNTAVATLQAESSSMSAEAASKPAESSSVPEPPIERPPSPRTTRPSGQAENAAASSESQIELPTEAVTDAANEIEELRRLFFSLIEHLRDTAQRQAELNDETSQTTAQAEGESLEREYGEQSTTQKTLAELASQIADALNQQSEQVAASADQAGQQPGQPQSQGQGQQPSPEQLKQNAETLAEASKLVAEGRDSMEDALSKLEKPEPRETPSTENEAASAADPTPPSDFEEFANSLAESQATALQKLAEALQLLDDRQSGQDQNQQQDQQENQQNEQQQDQQEQQSEQQQNMNAQQMLQAIRDREAERRKDKQKVNAAASGGVEKDW